MWEKVGRRGNLKAYWVGDRVVKEVRTGREGRMRANIGAGRGGDCGAGWGRVKRRRRVEEGK